MVTKVQRVERGEGHQPLLWTLIWFQTADDNTAWGGASSLLDPWGGWYCDFRSDAEVVVVFAGRTFAIVAVMCSGRGQRVPPRHLPVAQSGGSTYGRGGGPEGIRTPDLLNAMQWVCPGPAAGAGLNLEAATTYTDSLLSR